MKILVVGSGGREHAIAWKLAQSSMVDQVICIPGNGGTAVENKCCNIEFASCSYLENAEGNDRYVKVAQHENCELAVIGPENPLAEGIADAFWNAGIPAVGPKTKGAMLEASKDLSKEFMQKYNVACAESKTFTDKYEAFNYVEQKGAPIVIKADGLAAGKGVVVALTKDEALAAVKDLMEEGKVGDAGKKIVIEEYLRGVEISVLAAVSVTPEGAKAGKACIVPFVSARDHKRLNDGAKGPNTGGMGAVAPVPDVTAQQMEQFEKTILKPTLNGLISENMDYRGFIFFGIMLTKDGPKCLEYNVRLGDPETQAVLPLMDFDFAALCKAITDETLNSFQMNWKKGFSVSPVAVSGGYPNEYKKGMEITFNEDGIKESKAKIFIAGAITNRRASENITNKTLITNGGRVLACNALGETFQEAWDNAYKAMKNISFKGMYYRKDIGLPGAAESN